MLEALRLLGLRTDDDLRGAGVRLLELGMPVPLDPGIIRTFAAGLAEIVVVEEKNPTLEWVVKEALYSQNERPIVVRQACARRHVPAAADRVAEADIIAPRLRSRLLQRVAPERLTPDPATEGAQRAADGNGARELIPLSVNRTPFFCSGCPHNTSTRVPDGSLVGGGIGCHTMVMLMEPERFGNIVGITAMGNEGAQWFGMAPFVDEQHLFQNIGDGTLFHSGMLAVRAAVANGVNITYKVLYNGTVAMTGGQDSFGQLAVADLAKVFLAEGVKRVIVTTEDRRPLPRRVAAPRRRSVGSQPPHRGAARSWPSTPGTTVLIHDQRCAAEMRRDRKRQQDHSADVARRHRRARVRRVRRLRRRQQLPQRAGRRHAVRAQDAHRSGLLQPGRQLRARRLPVVHDGHTRPTDTSVIAALAASQRLADEQVVGGADRCVDDRRPCDRRRPGRLHDPPQRHRRHGRGHRQPGAGHRSDARRIPGARPRSDRVCRRRPDRWSATCG